MLIILRLAAYLCIVHVYLSTLNDANSAFVVQEPKKSLTYHNAIKITVNNYSEILSYLVSSVMYSTDNDVYFLLCAHVH